jgi:hypothetical protein
MNPQALPLWAQWLGLLYIGTGVFRLLCHPPRRGPAQDPGRAA